MSVSETPSSDVFGYTELTAREQRELAEQRARALEAAKREREQVATVKRQQVDDELAALERRLGKPRGAAPGLKHQAPD